MDRNATTSSAVAQETYLRSFINDLSSASARITEINARTGSVADRLSGAIPEPANASKGPATLSSVPSCVMDELRFQLNRALDHISECETRLGRIENVV